MYVIGLTGGIASGKSTVSAILRQEGAYIIDTDKIAYSITMPDQPAWGEIVSAFGRDILLRGGDIDRRKLGEIVFNNQNKKTTLESITHPKIMAIVNRRLVSATENGENIVVLDVPLLIEVGWQTLANEVWVVYADQETQLSRLMARNRFTQEQARARIKSQMSIKDKLTYADVVIDNNGSMNDTRTAVIDAWHRAVQRAKQLVGSNKLE